MSQLKSDLDQLNTSKGFPALISKENEISRLRLELEKAKTLRHGHTDGSLTDELVIYKELLKCNSCHVRQKDTVLTKCMHVFCKHCIDARLETRQRKCPNCGEPFGMNDVKQIFL
jgi:E3 ubiquitin-protein ligase BRE1